MKKCILSSCLFLLLQNIFAQDSKLPIIDIHLHAYTAWNPNATDSLWIPLYLPMPSTDRELMEMSLAQLKKYHIVKASTSGNIETVKRWYKADPERIIPAIMMNSIPEDKSFPDTIRSMFNRGEIKVLGELALQFSNIEPGDPALEPYLKLAEELDIPLGIHMGPGPSGGALRCCPNYRVRSGNPLLWEDALIKHPKLRLYIMHAGWPMLDNMVALLHSYSNVYVDVSVINWYIPRAEFHFYLKRLVDAGFGQRIMFGSDQCYWPDAIGLGIEGIDSAPFLNKEQKRDIFYNNAARFLRLSKEEIEAHHKK